MKRIFYRSGDFGTSTGGGGAASAAPAAAEPTTLDTIGMDDPDLADVLGGKANGAPTPPEPNRFAAPSFEPNKPAADPEKATNEPVKPANEPAAPAAPAAPTLPPVKPDANEEQIEYVNSADLVLNHVLGNKFESVRLGDEEIAIKDLSEEQSAEIVAEVINNLRQDLEVSAIRTEEEAQVINLLREHNGDLRALTNALAQNDPVFQTKSMTDEQVVMEHFIKKTFTTEEDQQAELTRLKDSGAVERYATNLRAQIEAQAKQSNLQIPQQQQNPNGEQDEAFVQAATQNLRSMREFEGFALPTEVIADVERYTLQADDSGDSEFVRELSDPAKLVEAAIWTRYGKLMMQEQSRQHQAAVEAAYKRGRVEALNGAPDAPIHNTGNGSQRPAQGAGGQAAGALNLDMSITRIGGD